MTTPTIDHADDWALALRCECPADGFCQRYQRTMKGRLREICRGINIDPVRAERYRENWAGLIEPSGGPGTELKRLLGVFGFKSDKECFCERHVKKMNRWGTAGCRENREEIIGWIHKEAAKRGWLMRVAADITTGWLVDAAIARAERKANGPA